jgi:hypothetical protein
MAEQRVTDRRDTIRSIDWQRVFPSLRIFPAVRMALNFKALLLSAIAVAGTVAGWRALDRIFSEETPATPVQTEFAAYQTWPWDRPLGMPHAESLTSPATWFQYSPLVTVWNELSVPFRRMYHLYETPTFTNFMFVLCCALWSLLIWSFFGGAISRLAAVGFARQENVSLGGLARFVNSRLGSYFVAPLFPILGAALVAVGLAVVGLILRAEIGVAIAGIALWPLVLFGGFVMAFLLLGLFFGFPLMWAAISAEGTDSFGALSHAYSYVYQRPLRYLGYATLAGLAGVLGWYLVSLFGYWILELAHWGVSWGSGTERLTHLRDASDLGRVTDTGRQFMQFWNNCLMTLALGYLFSYFWTSTTVIYFLLRRLVDAKELDEVYMPGEAAAYGLPPLQTGADGVPTVADVPTEPAS